MVEVRVCSLLLDRFIEVVLAGGAMVDDGHGDGSVLAIVFFQFSHLPTLI